MGLEETRNDSRAGVGPESALDAQGQGRKLENPLLPFLEKLNHDLPKKWNNRLRKYVPNDDWLLWEL